MESESKEEKFKRLVVLRVDNALKKIELIGNLARPQYAFSEEQVDKVLVALRQAVLDVEEKFKKPLAKKQRFAL